MQLLPQSLSSNAAIGNNVEVLMFHLIFLCVPYVVGTVLTMQKNSYEEVLVPFAFCVCVILSSEKLCFCPYGMNPKL